MRCIICGILLDSIDEAIESGWIPYFHEGDQQHEPVCWECAETLLLVDGNGEMEVRAVDGGKIRYPYGAEPEETPDSDWIMGIMIAEKSGGQTH